MNTVVRYANPVNALLNDLFSTSGYETKAKKFRPSVDIVEHDKEYCLYADIAGLGKKDITLTVEKDVLTISGEKKRVDAENDNYRYYERNHGSFERCFNLPEEVDQKKISAEMKNGELVVILKKKEEELPKRIDIAIE